MKRREMPGCEASADDDRFELTAANAAEYAYRRGLVSDGRSAAEKLPGGVSCCVVRLYPGDADPIVLKQALRKLTVAANWESDPERINNEVQFIRIASKVLGPDTVPDVLDEDPPNHIIAMTSAPLDAENWKQQLLAGKTSPELAAQCGNILGVLHSIPTDDPMITDGLRTKRFFCQLRIEAYLYHSACNEPDVAKELNGLAEDLLSVDVALVHADYTPKNFLVSDGRLFLLDFEVGHIGNPVFDVSSILNHFYLKSRLGRAEEFCKMSHSFMENYNPRSESVIQANKANTWRCLGGLMLARVRGKSPVEYLPDNQIPQVIRTAKALLRGKIESLEELY
jgi:tRNA A-37 threonylcarbamoyl transferase component Bud32